MVWGSRLSNENFLCEEIFSEVIAHVAPVSTAGELGETPRIRKLPEANRRVICFVLRGAAVENLLACLLKTKLYTGSVWDAVSGRY